MCRNVIEPSTSQRRWRFAFAGLLVVASLSWLLLCGLGISQLDEDWLGAIFFLLLNFQCSMLGFWAGLGSTRGRHVAFATASAALALIATRAIGGSNFPEFMVYCGGIAGVVAVTSGALRRWKGALQYAGTDSFVSEALRFGIRHIIIWTAVIAIVLGLGRYVVDAVGRVNVASHNTLFIVVALAACVAASTVVTIWALLGNRISLVKILTELFVAVAASAGSYVLMNGMLFFTAATGLSQLMTALAIYALRRQGYRFVKPAKQR